tara:strand:+ start:1915 stop:2319 length:405 start_codon:yes stop_codon:yes gene_type:complete
MFSFFNKTYKKISFEDMQQAIKQNYTIINTLSSNKQDCLIQNTINCNEEENTINNLLNNYVNTHNNIIIYGENGNDNTVEEKYNQLIKCGFYNVFIYPGGLFEWLLLQDIYGSDEFLTTSNTLNILKYKASKQI